MCIYIYIYTYLCIYVSLSHHRRTERHRSAAGLTAWYKQNNKLILNYDFIKDKHNTKNKLTIQ